MIEVRGLTKRYGDTLAVDDLSFDIQPGVVTGFLGPNGAGKSTTMRMILGLDRPTSGTVTINGSPYTALVSPLREIGALVDAKAIQGGRSARQHLSWVARAGRIPQRRVDEVLEVVGLTSVANRKVGGFSLGMSQRLGIATALLGDPDTLLFDEPVNGLDPEGIRWIRTLLKRLAAEGRTVFVSSHLMSEMQETADHVLVIARGRLVADTTMADFTRRSTRSHVRIVSPDAAALVSILTDRGAAVGVGDDGALAVVGMDAARVGELAANRHIRLHELTERRASLEVAFMELTQDNTEYQGSRAAEIVTAA